ncbi:hypothetical protein J6590_033108 [Homalodisca vitripennis]|nr:hypothetical protein J6590_033108 [Homalodisca vitripennis]
MRVRVGAEDSHGTADSANPSPPAYRLDYDNLLARLDSLDWAEQRRRTLASYPFPTKESTASGSPVSVVSLGHLREEMWQKLTGHTKEATLITSRNAVETKSHMTSRPYATRG